MTMNTTHNATDLFREVEEQLLEAAPRNDLTVAQVLDYLWHLVLPITASTIGTLTDLPFLFTSTAMVFDHVPDGPHHPGGWPDARSGHRPGRRARDPRG